MIFLSWDLWLLKRTIVGPRDGLQNETKTLSVDTRLEFIEKLSETGLRHIESAAFVSPRWVPRMAGASEIMSALSEKKPASSIIYSALVPNLKGYEAAKQSGTNTVAVFTAASETFNMKNTNCSIEESIERFRPIFKQANADDIRVRGYVSCVVGCPFEGLTIKPEKVADVSERLLDMGCYEISLGDTIGIGTPGSTEKMLQEVIKRVPVEKIAVHYHNTYGQALANILRALDIGVRVIDSSVSGLGGCPYANGATGNVSTEDVVYMLNGMGFQTGIDIKKLSRVGQWICDTIGNKSNESLAGKAILSKIDQSC